MNHSVLTVKAPAAIGPYSQGISSVGGRLIFVSGQLPLDPSTGRFAGEDIQSQTQQSLKNIQAILEEAGYSLADVVKTTVYIRNMSDFSLMNEVYARFFTGNCPARSAVEVSRLPKDALVEIEAIASKD